MVLRFQDVYFGSEHGSFCHAPFLFSDVMKSLYTKWRVIVDFFKEKGSFLGL